MRSCALLAVVAALALVVAVSATASLGPRVLPHSLTDAPLRTVVHTRAPARPRAPSFDEITAWQRAMHRVVRVRDDDDDAAAVLRAQPQSQSQSQSPQPGCVYDRAADRMDERAALAALFASASGTAWFHSDFWLSDAVSVCCWFGVACSTSNTSAAGSSISNTVTSLQLAGAGLVGVLPPQLSLLSALQQLIVSDNLLHQPFPDFLTAMTALQSIGLQRNEFFGTLPSGLAALTQLTKLAISSNGAVGSVPDFLFGMTSLVNLGIDANAFAGTVPAGIGQLTRLSFLSMGVNGFTGSIPTEIFRLTNLVVLGMGGCQLTGSMPNEISQLVNLYQIGVNANMLSGSLPAGLLSLTRLAQLAFDVNRFDGTIPSWIGQLTALQNLGLADNALSGTLPSELGSLVQLTHLGLGYNAFEGSLPESLANLTALELFDATLNKLTGSLPTALFTALTRLAWFGLSVNPGITGTIPSQISGLKAVQSLTLSFNGLSGELPAELASLAAVQHLYLSNSAFSGQVPRAMGAMRELSVLDVSNNALNGTLPATFVNSLAMISLYLHGNAFTGALPVPQTCTSIFAQDNLFESVAFSPGGNLITLLSAHGNAIRGPFPSEVCQYGQFVDLSSNFLSGPLPAAPQLTDAGTWLLDGNVGMRADAACMSTSETLVDCLPFSGDKMSRVLYDELQASTNNTLECARVLLYGEPNLNIDLDTKWYTHYRVCRCVPGRFQRPFTCCSDDTVPFDCLPCPPECDCDHGRVSGCYPSPGDDLNTTEWTSVAPCPTIGVSGTACNPLPFDGHTRNHTDPARPWQRNAAITREDLFACAAGYEGRLCSRCAVGYFRSGFACDSCNNITTTLTLVVVPVAVVALVLYTLFVPGRSTSAIQILVFHVQALRALMLSGAVSWTEVVHAVFRGTVQAVSVAPVAPECVVPGRVYTLLDDFVLFAVLPVIAALVVPLLVYAVARALLAGCAAINRRALVGGARLRSAADSQATSSLLSVGATSAPHYGSAGATLAGSGSTPASIRNSSSSSSSSSHGGGSSSTSSVLASTSAAGAVGKDTVELRHASALRKGAADGEDDSVLDGDADDADRGRYSINESVGAVRSWVCCRRFEWIASRPTALRMRIEYMMLFMLVQVYLVTVGKALSGLGCTLTAPGTSALFLAAYPWVTCRFDAGEFASIMPLAVAMTLVYAVGVPVLVGVLTWLAARGRIGEPRASVLLGFLVGCYNQDARYWGVVLLVRRAVLVAIVSMSPFDSPAIEITAVLLLLQVSTMAQHALHPFDSTLSNFLELFSLYTLTATYVLAFLTRYLDAIGLASSWISWVIVALNSVVLLAIGVTALIIIVAPRIRRLDRCLRRLAWYARAVPTRT